MASLPVLKVILGFSFYTLDSVSFSVRGSQVLQWPAFYVKYGVFEKTYNFKQNCGVYESKNNPDEKVSAFLVGRIISPPTYWQ